MKNCVIFEILDASFETQFKVVLLKTDPEHHFPDPHSFKLSNRTDNLNAVGRERSAWRSSGLIYIARNIPDKVGTYFE